MAEAQININNNNYQEYLLLYVDKELTAAQEKELLQFVEKHPSAKEELEALQMTVSEADESLVFEDKEALYRTTGRVRLLYRYWYLSAAAAAAILILLCWLLRYPVKTSDHKLAENIQSNIIDTPATKPAARIAAQPKAIAKTEERKPAKNRKPQQHLISKAEKSPASAKADQDNISGHKAENTARVLQLTEVDKVDQQTENNIKPAQAIAIPDKKIAVHLMASAEEDKASDNNENAHVIAVFHGSSSSKLFHTAAKISRLFSSKNKPKERTIQVGNIEYTNYN